MFWFKKNKNKNRHSRNHYFDSPAFTQSRHAIIETIESLEQADSPIGWQKGNTFAVGGLEYVGFSRDSLYLLVVSSRGRGVIDVETQQLVARDKDTDSSWLDETRLTCQGIGPIKDEIITITGLNGGGLLKGNRAGESLSLSAEKYPAYTVIYQPAYQHFLIKNHDKGCTVIYQGFVNYAGFSWSGNTFIVVDEDINFWNRDIKLPVETF